MITATSLEEATRLLKKEPRSHIVLAHQKHDAPPRLKSRGLTAGARALDARGFSRLESRGFQNPRHDERFNRTIIEQSRCDILVLNHTAPKKDTLRSLDTITEVLARLAAKKKTAMGIDLVAVRALPRKTQVLELARIRQTLKICRDAHCPIKVLNVYTPEGSRALLQMLGASSEQTKHSLSDTISPPKKTSQV